LVVMRNVRNPVNAPNGLVVGQNVKKPLNTNGLVTAQGVRKPANENGLVTVQDQKDEKELRNTRNALNGGASIATGKKAPASAQKALVVGQNGRNPANACPSLNSAIATGKKAPANAQKALVVEQNGRNPANAHPSLNSAIATGPSAARDKTHVAAADHADPVNVHR
ncbi:MAG TPA: hypothetical protein VF532_21595, partial [Candidatus Angelobacter sp.]